MLEFVRHSISQYKPFLIIPLKLFKHFGILGHLGVLLLKRLLKRCRWFLSDLREVHHADGTSKHSTHLVNIMLPKNIGIHGLLVTESPNVVRGFGRL